MWCRGANCNYYWQYNERKTVQNTAVILNIEGKGAVEKLDEILEVDSVDALFVGLFDLSKSMGIPGEVENPRVLKSLQEITIKSKKAGKQVGTIATSEESLKQFLDMGINYLVYLVDCDVLRNAYENAVRLVKG